MDRADRSGSRSPSPTRRTTGGAEGGDARGAAIGPNLRSAVASVSVAAGGTTPQTPPISGDLTQPQLQNMVQKLERLLKERIELEEKNFVPFAQENFSLVRNRLSDDKFKIALDDAKSIITSNCAAIRELQGLKAELATMARHEPASTSSSAGVGSTAPGNTSLPPPRDWNDDSLLAEVRRLNINLTGLLRLQQQLTTQMYEGLFNDRIPYFRHLQLEIDQKAIVTQGLLDALIEKLPQEVQNSLRESNIPSLRSPRYSDIQAERPLQNKILMLQNSLEDLKKKHTALEKQIVAYLQLREQRKITDGELNKLFEPISTEKLRISRKYEETQVQLKATKEKLLENQRQVLSEFDTASASDPSTDNPDEDEETLMRQTIALSLEDHEQQGAVGGVAVSDNELLVALVDEATHLEDFAWGRQQQHARETTAASVQTPIYHPRQPAPQSTHAPMWHQPQSSQTGAEGDDGDIEFQLALEQSMREHQSREVQENYDLALQTVLAQSFDSSNMTEEEKQLKEVLELSKTNK